MKVEDEIRNRRTEINGGGLIEYVKKCVTHRQITELEIMGLEETKNGLFLVCIPPYDSNLK